MANEYTPKEKHLLEETLNFLSKRELSHILDKITHAMSLHTATVSPESIRYTYRFTAYYTIASMIASRIKSIDKKSWLASTPHFQKEWKRLTNKPELLQNNINSNVLNTETINRQRESLETLRQAYNSTFPP